MLYITSPWLILWLEVCTFWPLHLFHLYPIPCPGSGSRNLFPASVSLFFFLLRLYIYVKSHGICFSIWLSSLNIRERSICVSQMARFHSFYGWIIFLCVCVCDIFFMYPSISGLLDCFHVLIIVYMATVNMGIIFHWVCVP